MDKIEQNYFKKYDIDLSKCKNKTKEYLSDAKDYASNIEKNFKIEIMKAFTSEINISSFCDQIGITRMALYKKDNYGKRNNESVIKYLNLKNDELKTLKKIKINEYLMKIQSIINYLISY